MFFWMNEEEKEELRKRLEEPEVVEDEPGLNEDEPPKQHEEFMRDYHENGKTWRRIKRPVYSKFWRVMHNLVAHPMLAVYRPWGQKLHDWTAEKMYAKPNKDAKPISQSD